MAVCLGKALQAIFFGNLRAIEVEVSFGHQQRKEFLFFSKAKDIN